ncbi:MAG: hypothetical protein ABFD15_07455 [Methanofastidiosum sp.]
MDELVENMKEACESHFEEQIDNGEEIRILSISDIEVLKSAKVARN